MGGAADVRTGGSRRRAWLSAALLSLLLLVLPLAVWLILPRPSPLALPRGEPAPALTVEATASSEAREAPAPRARRSVTAPLPSAAQPASVGASMRGLVLDPDGRAVAGAFVLCTEDPHASATSDAEGRFELPPEADGCTAVATLAPHGASEPTRLASGSDNVLRLTRGGAISGNVVDEAGKPVPAYLLAIESYLPTGSHGRARTSREARKIFDEAGAFLWEDLPPGRYVLTASAAGRPPARSDSIDVESARTTHHARIVLPRGATLTGKVMDADSREPIANAQLELDGATSSSANAISLVLTDASGAYELEGVPAGGPFSVRVRHERYMTKIVSGLDARGARSLQADVELRVLGDGGSREELTGIGATLMPSPKGVVIAGLIEGGPAARAGLDKGDRIVRIDGAEAAEMPLSDCIQRLRGPAGTRVSVGVERAGEVLEFTVRRETVVH